MIYHVYLKPVRGIMLVEADKMCAEPDAVVFYARPAAGEKFQEVRRFEYNTIAKIEESPLSGQGDVCPTT